jgi:hypothetical protein
VVYKNQLTPLSPKGQISKVAGKGGQATAMPDRRQIKQLAQGAGGIGNYAKAAPTIPAPGVKAPFGTYDLE